MSAATAVGKCGTRREIEVLERRGVWALTRPAFKADGGTDAFLVMHVPTGLRIINAVLDEEEARALLAVLGTEAADFMASAELGDEPEYSSDEAQHVGQLVRAMGFKVCARKVPR